MNRAFYNDKYLMFKELTFSHNFYFLAKPFQDTQYLFMYLSVYSSCTYEGNDGIAIIVPGSNMVPSRCIEQVVKTINELIS